jgi:RNA polymerase sigma-70 factor (ECF subfamily)
VRRHGREILSGDSALGDSPVEPEALTKLAADADAQALRRCLETLEENQRRSVMLAFVEGFSHGEIAKRLSAPLGTVKSWVRRGLMALKGCLAT